MTFRHSLRVRIIIAFCLFGAILGSVYAAAVYLSLDRIEDYLVNRRLVQEVEYFSSKFQEGSGFPTPTSLYIKAYIGVENMPLYVKKQVGGLPEGYHEFYWKDAEYHVAIKVIPELVEPVYLLYEVSALEFTEQRKLGIGIVLITGVILVIGLGFWLGLLTSRKVIAPVTHLAKQVNLSGPHSLPTDLSTNFYGDEVGVLAKALEESMQRVQALIEREKQFTRDASHELRTPVTVIKGAVELLHKLPGADVNSVRRPLKRIERAVTDMENIIESLLWLAREEAINNPEQNCVVVPVVKEAIEQLHQLHKGNSIEIECIAEGNPRLNAPPPILQMIIVNLIQNAFHHTADGKISIHICNESITVTDTGIGIDNCALQIVAEPHVRGEHSQGYGLGLSIVKRLCDQFGWQLDIESEVNRGTKVQLRF
jgi:signal transduction histidine kinase